jgi:HAE1 family hydrophobic/amphiphilic exporter-1
MTSFAFILGCVPLATATGAGGLSRQVMGYVVIGGMMAASFVSVTLIPVLFYLVEKYSGKKPHPKKTEASTLAAGEVLGLPS